jgi:hypothetical protein
MDLISVLILTYVIGGHIIESEHPMPHSQCMAAEATIAKTFGTKTHAIVQLLSGDRVPMSSVVCLPACMADGEPLTLLKDEA